MTAMTATIGARADSPTMQALVHERYGPPAAVLTLGEVERPTIGDDGILVRVRASSANAMDWHLVRGAPFLARISEGLLRPKQTTPGVDVAGVVEAVGRDVTELQPGDEVFGARDGAMAEYVAGRLRNFVRKPGNITFEQAAAIPVAAITALQGLRDQGHVKAGQRVLVLGAGGGVGSFTVQIAKAFGATVTATTSTPNLETVRSIGADEVVDYTIEDVTRSGRRFDLVLDVGGYASLGALRRVVAGSGRIVVVGAGKATIVQIVARIIEGKLRSRLRGDQIHVFLAKITRDDLLVLADLAAAGKITPVIDRTYPLAEAGQAIRYVETGQARGKVVITVTPGMS
jgi:NADPH:quinone reductase-like Zn-dependent oxidoreductase